MSDQPAVPTGRLTPEQIPDWTHLPNARLKNLDPRTQRSVQARIRRLLREADRAEGLALGEVLDQLEQLQRFVRDTLAGAGQDTPFAVLWTELERRIDDTMGQVAGTVATSLDDAATLGTRLVDEALDVAGAAPPAADVADVDEGIRLTARQLLAEAQQNLKLRTTQQTLMLSSGQQDLDRTLRMVGTQLKGSPVFGAPSARVANVVRTQLGEAHGAAVEARTSQSNTLPGAVVARKRWLWSHDPTGGREEHAFAERRYAPGGEIGPIAPGELYRVGRYSTPYPRGPGLPGVHKINCGCRSVPVLMALDPEETA